MLVGAGSPRSASTCSGSRAGQAWLVGDDLDGVADRIVDGAWAAEMNLGRGVRHTPATFSATR